MTIKRSILALSKGYILVKIHKGNQNIKNYLHFQHNNTKNSPLLKNMAFLKDQIQNIE